MNTRDDAYLAHKASGKANTQRQRILALLAQSKLPLLRDEIADELKLRPTSICGRLAELMEEGKVVEGLYRVNPDSGMTCKTYRLPQPGEMAAVEQSDLFGEAA